MFFGGKGGMEKSCNNKDWIDEAERKYIRKINFILHEWSLVERKREKKKLQFSTSFFILFKTEIPKHKLVDS